jgi:branched-subunit amino acid ABC-type transport system permease component
VSGVPQHIVFGLGLGAIYALVAMGFSLVFRTMGLVNFSHGNVVMIGAYLASTFYLSACRSGSRLFPSESSPRPCPSPSTRSVSARSAGAAGRRSR